MNFLYIEKTELIILSGTAQQPQPYCNFENGRVSYYPNIGKLFSFIDCVKCYPH